MAMDGFTKDMNIIQKLNDEPNDRDGLTAGELKAKFDEGGLAVKEYLNNTVKPYVEGLEEDADTHAARTDNPHSVTKTQVGLGNVPNVSTNNQTPTYTMGSANENLTSGEKLSVAFGKLAKAVSSLISHLADSTRHITAAERTSWNSKAAGSHTHGAGDITSGVLPIARGGTGKTTAAAAASALLSEMDAEGATYDVLDSTLIATSANSGENGKWYRRSAVKFWNYIKGKADAVYAAISHTHTIAQVTNLQTTLNGKAATSHTHAASDIDSGTLPIARGGTGQTTAKAAATSLLTSLDNGDTVMRDETMIVTSKYDGSTDVWYKRPASLLWSYVKGKADALYAAVSHKHDDRYPTLLDGTVITSSAADPADLNDVTYQVPGTYNCRSSAIASTVKHTPYYDANTLVNTDMLAFVLRVSYGVGTNKSISQELRTLNDGWVYHRYLQVSSGIWTAWTLVRGTASALNQHLTVNTATAQDAMYFATTAATGETGTWYKRPASAIWDYIKGKAAAELYITAGQRNGAILGQYATAEGQNTVSFGVGAHTEGGSTGARGDWSHAEGHGTEANSKAQHVFGEFNENPDDYRTMQARRGTYVEIVGNGNDGGSRSNARTLNWYGNEWIAGTLTQASDARLKDVVGEVPDVSSIRAVRFRWNDKKGTHDEKDHIGYLAQDVEQIAPFLVGDDSNGYKSLDYIALLCAKVEWLERKVKALQAAAETEGGN